MVRDVDDIFVSSRSDGRVVVCENCGASIAFEKYRRGSEWLLVPVSGQGIHVMPVEKNGGFEVIFRKVVSESVLAMATEIGVQRWRCLGHEKFEVNPKMKNPSS